MPRKTTRERVFARLKKRQTSLTKNISAFTVEQIRKAGYWGEPGTTRFHQLSQELFAGVLDLDGTQELEEMCEEIRMPSALTTFHTKEEWPLISQ